ncbi:MAG: hypothetical protein EA402_09305 [Planctomycetota bacterium]|nr:MAG: hypothetical protein EA402_09305 [Planctomycetota bacterium]
MKPSLRQSYQRAGIAATSCLLLAAGIIHFGWDRGRLAEEHRLAWQRYEQRIGHYPLSEVVDEFTRAVSHSQGQIDELKGLVGMSPVAPFLKPRRDSGGYIAFLIRFLHQELSLKAQSFEIDPRLGFNLLGSSPPSEEAAEGWLTMLQLVTKALFLCTEASTAVENGGVDEVVVTRLTTTPIPTGPRGRPPLLNEYPFTLRITASLSSISWLLQQFSADERTPGNKDEDLRDWLRMIERGVEAARFTVVRPSQPATIGPLIVRGFHITGSRIEDNRISRLVVTIDLAGMEFLSDEQRGERGMSSSGPRRAPAARGGGTTVPMARP